MSSFVLFFIAVWLPAEYFFNFHVRRHYKATLSYYYGTIWWWQHIIMVYQCDMLMVASHGVYFSFTFAIIASCLFVIHHTISFIFMFTPFININTTIDHCRRVLIQPSHLCDYVSQINNFLDTTWVDRDINPVLRSLFTFCDQSVH